MFEEDKNKEENKKEKTSQVKNFSGDKNTVFHTMQDDLKNADKKGVSKKDSPSIEIEEEPIKKEGNNYNGPFGNKEYEKEKPLSSIKPLNSYSRPSQPQRQPQTSLNSSTSSLKKDLKPLSETKKNKIEIEKSSISRFLIPVMIALIIISAASGFFILWKTRNSSESQIEPSLNESGIEALTENPEVIESPSEKYSSENPNYLHINTESDSAEDISQKLKQIASEINGSGEGKLFEFVVTDANNNPLSFSIFAYLYELEISSEILNDLEESFSLYFYANENNKRLGTAVDIKNKEDLSAKMSKEESKLVNELENLFLGNPYSETGKSFNTSQYKNFEIRYINLDENNTLSVDYVLTENQLVIGTSKDTARAIADKII